MSAVEQSESSLAKKIIAPIILGVLLVACWHAVSASGSVPETLLPSPADVWQRLTYDLTQTSLLYGTWVTVWEALLGCLVASVVAIPLGYVIARWPVADTAVSPYVAASQAVPAIAIAPLLVIWIGYGLRPIVILCALMVFFPVLLATRLGFSSVDRDVVQAAKLDGANSWQLLAHIQWPLALPAVMTGLRNGFTMSITGAVVGEFVMGGEGLGMIIATQSANIDSGGLFSTIIVLCALAILVYSMLMLIEKLTDPMAPVRSKKNQRLAKLTVDVASDAAPELLPIQGESDETASISARSRGRSSLSWRHSVLKKAS